MKKFFYSKKSFSLVELSVVIVIMTIIITSGLLVLSNQRKVTMTKETKKRIKVINESMGRYFAENHRIPCPSDPTIPLTNQNFSKEYLDTTGTGCAGDFMPSDPSKPQPLPNQIFDGDYYSQNKINKHHFLFGGVPTSVLGLPDDYAFDGYGNRFTYVISESIANTGRHVNDRYKNLGIARMEIFNSSSQENIGLYNQCSRCSKSNFYGVFGDSTETNPINRNQLSFSSCNIEVSNYINQAKVTDVENNIAYVVISHGENGYGGWNKSGSMNPISNNQYEASNSYAYYYNSSSGSYTDNYKYQNTGVNKPIKFYYGQKGDVFDDIISWNSLSSLINKNKNIDIVKCHYTTFPNFIDAVSSDQVPIGTVGDLVSINITTNANESKKITARCSLYGIWIASSSS